MPQLGEIVFKEELLYYVVSRYMYMIEYVLHIQFSQYLGMKNKPYKVHISWEGHKILRNLPLTFDYSTYSQKLGEDFAKFCGLLRIYEL